MFAADTSILAYHNNYDDFMTVFNLVLLHNSKWFQANQLILNVEKTSIIRFTLTKLSHHPLHVAYADQILTALDTLKFFGLHFDNHPTWKPHIDFHTS
jgi:hypothetical protein